MGRRRPATGNVGNSAQVIVDVISQIPLDQKLIVKKFQDLSATDETKVTLKNGDERCRGPLADIPAGCASETHGVTDVRKFLRT